MFRGQQSRRDSGAGSPVEALGSGQRGSRLLDRPGTRPRLGVFRCGHPSGGTSELLPLPAKLRLAGSATGKQETAGKGSGPTAARRSFGMPRSVRLGFATPFLSDSFGRRCLPELPDWRWAPLLQDTRSEWSSWIRAASGRPHLCGRVQGGSEDRDRSLRPSHWSSVAQWSEALSSFARRSRSWRSASLGFGRPARPASSVWRKRATPPVSPSPSRSWSA